MRIFNQIEEIVKSAKSAKSSNELLSVGKELANLAEFQTLINFISEKLSLDDEDLRAESLLIN